ncbi:MAG: hypothetical protein ACJAS6_001071 [Rickettsiales bacterium]|jgi:hypothetical protein
MTKINFLIKRKLIDLEGTCFHYYDTSFYPFLSSCGVSDALTKKYPRSSFNKYQIMDNILNDLEGTNKDEIISSMISNFYQMSKAVDDNYFRKEHPERSKKAKELLGEFKELVGNDPIEQGIKNKQSQANREKYQQEIIEHKSKKDELLKLKDIFIEMHNKDDKPQ